ncbi:DUF3119 family protein [Cyanobium sp. PCC 7001]|uniref:DUF3119 family protein n=1 Tax=Cyanobium sp. PCC 7001 TaxID=180281 RepID=UPI0005BAB1D0|nr:DUF3119 family protein [Cyanobium sp. PCC 7001]
MTNPPTSPSDATAADLPNRAAPQPAAEDGTLPAHYGVALGVVGVGLACLGLTPLWAGALWLSLAVSLLGLFLVVQTALLRLEFQEEALVVWRQAVLLRRFPYSAWKNWRLFWPGLPVVFYFREEQSPHLLPLLFDAKALRQQLDRHLSHLPAPDA